MTMVMPGAKMAGRRVCATRLARINATRTINAGAAFSREAEIRFSCDFPGT
ncbi:hypothetical protein [Lysobacter solisilvae (ex Woo and Kim 2020)]|uniref:Uncharacterized protein n=1 Tax=Agrilutibacter terrestris TaxID=2865112 RepID=A0A7H0FUW0_9GAMM|nr:hypothetical protein [Lysobacter terrestris]QNP39826.1 hypothetical protein H8B22_09930 [Lysobacter terrestris]